MEKNYILKSWDLVNHDNKIKKFYFIPGLIGVIFLMIILVYQVIYTYVVLFNKQDKALGIILNIFHSEYFIEVIIFGLILFIFYIIFIPICEGTLIWYLSKKESIDKEVSIGDSFGGGLYSFLPLFEYGNIFSQFKFISIINIYLFCLRFIGIKYIEILSSAFLGLLLISVVINILSVYGKFEIVLNNKKSIEALSESIKIAILNIKTTIKIYFFLFLLNLRILLNFFVFLLFPIIISSATLYITSKFYLFITISILTTLFIALTIILGYLGGVFDILKTSIWYNAYIDGKNKADNLKDEK
ncbi:hypothetical protein H3C61_02935 [Candidatus Gracilibacteria bacterium]|nr:hypothetical protein [Candidatus Gracilibacteria bacterium]